MKKNAINQLNNYRKIQINTASPAQRVVIVYDGIIRKLNEAINAFDNDQTPNRFETINNSLQFARQIIFELQLALDMEKGGEIAISLNNLYLFWLNQLSEANVKKEKKPVIDILELVTDMRNTWEKAAQEARKMGIA